MKRCPTCKQDKPEIDFNKSRNRGDGLDWQCRECAHNKDARYRATEHAKELSRIKARGAWRTNPDRLRRNHQRWYAKMPHDKRYLYHRKHNLKKCYGISFGEYMELYRKQEGRCFICHRPGIAFGPTAQRGKVLAVDHNHMTGKIRALLCLNCNTLIGLVHENPKWLMEVYNYLVQFPRENKGPILENDSSVTLYARSNIDVRVERLTQLAVDEQISTLDQFITNNNSVDTP